VGVADLRFDQVNIVLSDVDGAAQFLRSLGVRLPEVLPEWADWASHHVGFPTAAEGFDADLDSSAYARHWGGLPAGFTGVVVNLRTPDRDAVDATFEQALRLGALALRSPYDASWGARYAVVQASGPIVVGLMSPADDAHRGAPPALSDFV
jgi:hypothetical protein